MVGGMKHGMHIKVICINFSVSRALFVDFVLWMEQRQNDSIGHDILGCSMSTRFAIPKVSGRIPWTMPIWNLSYLISDRDARVSDFLTAHQTLVSHPLCSVAARAHTIHRDATWWKRQLRAGNEEALQSGLSQQADRDFLASCVLC